MANTDAVLYDDVCQIEEALASFEGYSFARDIDTRMSEAKLSSSLLGKRLGLSHTIVDKWRKGSAKPNGKERLKEIGMALGMNEHDLNAFLYRNGYPRLYTKNPLDSAARLILMNNSNTAGTVKLYRDTVERLGLEGYVPHGEAGALKSQLLSGELKKAALDGSASKWFIEHKYDFTGDGKTQMADVRIARFILLYTGDATIHELSVTGELPGSLKRLLYPLIAGKAVNVRGLRDKLIAFGLYCNMTEDELDALLGYARLRPFTEAETMLDMACLYAVRCAHERYAHYECDNLSRVVSRLREGNGEYEAQLLPDYSERLFLSSKLTDYYDRQERTALEDSFEKRYTSYCDRGVMDYVHDVLICLTHSGALAESEAGGFIELIGRDSDGEPIW